MIAPSTVHQLPRGDAGMRLDEAARYARQEYGTPSTAWMMPATPHVSVWTGLRIRLASVFARSPEPHPALQRAEPRLLSGAEATQLVASERHRHDLTPHPAHPHAALDGAAMRGLVFPVLEADETTEPCECPP